MIEDELEESGVALQAKGAVRCAVRFVPACPTVVPEHREGAVRKARETANGGLELPSAHGDQHQGVWPVGGHQVLHLSDARQDFRLLLSKSLQALLLVRACRLEGPLSLGHRR